MKLIVLMSTYNGEKYLKEQLDSLINQSLLPTKILIRDDGSTDSTIDILKEYSSKYSYIEFYQGENKGPAKSFWELINKAKGYDYYSLCDQDDVWFKDKLEKAISTLEEEDKKIPLLYCSRFTLTDENLNPQETRISKLYQYNDFAHALLYQTAPGCTFVFNNEARNRIIEYDIENKFCMIHDSIIHKIVTMFGKMIIDENSTMYYRQHSGNAIGLSGNPVKTFIGRVRNLFSGKIKNTRSMIAKSLLDVYGNKCNDKYKELTDIVANYRNNPVYKKALLTRKCFKVEGINYFFFKILVLVNYI